MRLFSFWFVTAVMSATHTPWEHPLIFLGFYIYIDNKKNVNKSSIIFLFLSVIYPGDITQPHIHYPRNVASVSSVSRRAHIAPLLMFRDIIPMRYVSWDTWPKGPFIPARKRGGILIISPVHVVKFPVKYSVLRLVMDRSLRKYSYCNTIRNFSLILP
jgi:hypothetical protein